MCGIVGYIGKDSSKNYLLTGLKNLEYRGYDSCGVATIRNGLLDIYKSTKRVDDLVQITEKIKFSNVGIGHTRWSTHGKSTIGNAHPHIDYKKTFAVVHNGIIENFVELKNMLIKNGFLFYSETDTEVIPNLLLYNYSGDIKKAISKTLQILKGSFALGIISINEPEKIYVAKQKSPLLIGIKENENFIASDTNAILEYTNNVYILENEEFAEITQNQIYFYNFNLQPINKESTIIEYDKEIINLGKYNYYMQKEIFENPTTVRNTLNAYFDKEKNIDLNLKKSLLNNIEKINIVACGTAMHAGLAAKYTIEELTRIPVSVEVASEFRYKKFILKDTDLVIFISQSGETADTIEALEIVKTHRIKHISIVNVKGSTLDRMSENVLYTKAGTEVAVASTKAYISQVILLNIFAIFIAKNKCLINDRKQKYLVNELFEIPSKIDIVLQNYKIYKEYAEKIKNEQSLFFIGRGIDYYSVLEGSLKLKEVSYIHSEAYQAGELKHGTIALVEKGTKVISVCTDDKLLEKMFSNIKEVMSRGADVLFISGCKKEVEKIFENVIEIPKTNKCFSILLSVIPMQLIAYYTAISKGLDVDKPRNLAKSVTVE